MGFKYINPGVINTAYSYIKRSTSTTHSQFGYSFYATSPFPLFTLDQHYDEVYAKFDVYFPSLTSEWNFALCFYDTDYGLGNQYTGTRNKLLFSLSRSKRVISGKTSYYPSFNMYSLFDKQRTIGYVSDGYNKLNALTGGKYHTFFLHFANKSLTQLYIDGNILVDRADETHEDTNSSTQCAELYFDTLTFNSSTTACYISNIIVSDSRITPNEKMIEVPISSTSTNMTESSGVYTASSVGNYLLQTPNKSSLVSSYPNHRVTGISTVAQPAYTNGTPTTIAGRESSLKHDSTVLTTSNVAGALSSWKANFAMSQIDSKQYGWEVIA